MVDALVIDDISEKLGAAFWSGAVVTDDIWLKESRQFELAMTVWRAHHGNLSLLIAKPSHLPGPFAFDHRSTFELQAKVLASEGWLRLAKQLGHGLP